MAEVAGLFPMLHTPHRIALRTPDIRIYGGDDGGPDIRQRIREGRLNVELEAIAQGQEPHVLQRVEL